MRVRRDKTGIDHSRNVIFDKSAFVSGFAAELTKIIFPGRQRAEPDEILNEKTPNEARADEVSKPIANAKRASPPKIAKRIKQR